MVRSRPKRACALGARGVRCLLPAGPDGAVEQLDDTDPRVSTRQSAPRLGTMALAQRRGGGGYKSLITSVECAAGPLSAGLLETGEPIGEALVLRDHRADLAEHADLDVGHLPHHRIKATHDRAQWCDDRCRAATPFVTTARFVGEFGIAHKGRQGRSKPYFDPNITSLTGACCLE
jgi:hypothetical protein